MKRSRSPSAFFLRFLAASTLLWGGILPAVAIPNSFLGNGNFIGPVIPAQPRFRANLTEEFLDAARWEGGELPGPWDTLAVPGDGVSLRKMSALPVLFGAVPDSVFAREEEGRLREVVIVYLNAGTFFPYRSGGERTREQRREGDERRAEFERLWRTADHELRTRLEEGCGASGQQVVAGRSDALRTACLDYVWEDFRLRLARRSGHSIALHVSLAAETAPSWIDPVTAGMNRDERIATLAGRVASSERGEQLIQGVPVFDQGFTPYCGVHALAMVAHYHGLRVLPGTLASGAGFRNTGSARGSRIDTLYRAVGEELGLKMSNSSRFDTRRASRAIRAGQPVIVWRRVSAERETAHRDYAAALRKAPGLAPPPFDAEARGTLPSRDAKGAPSHASVVVGMAEERDILVYLEPWGEEAGERRMLSEEMEASAYAVFYYNP